MTKPQNNLSDHRYYANINLVSGQIIQLHLQNAFDTIDHKILLDKFVFSICIFKFSHIMFVSNNSLSNRTFIVNVENDYSDPGDLTSGVPPGSI